MKEKLKKSNLKTYGNEEGPTAESLYKKDNYPKYVILGEAPAE